jgi:hypothetical protein
MELESFELILLRRPPDAPGYDEETLQRIQKEHLAYNASPRASGEIATNGPVMDSVTSRCAVSRSTGRDHWRAPGSSQRRTRPCAPGGLSLTS